MLGTSFSSLPDRVTPKPQIYQGLTDAPWDIVLYSLRLVTIGSTILLVTHDPRWLPMVQRSVELFDGTIVDG